jgi:hypothetical protein
MQWSVILAADSPARFKKDRSDRLIHLIRFVRTLVPLLILGVVGCVLGCWGEQGGRGGQGGQGVTPPDKEASKKIADEMKKAQQEKMKALGSQRR